ncbi:hypothetical protein BC936DRAFT_147157 [Jimgerdemannia flammicorona]|uniref:Uncharacterized protein n=1 Tax=Jimgerdemannia flammicorona TaxID=994334 RepID=A0A433D608_9FUNG|nr:hypothetical protein BC936DRAFT_147157 [Jimgerdemannia flammicorona]
MPPHNNEACPEAAIRVGATFAVAGLLVSSVQNSLGTHSQGAKGVFTRTGGTIGFFGTFPFFCCTTLTPPPHWCHFLYTYCIPAAMGGVFAATECIVGEIRKEDDALNRAAAGCAAGIVAGIRAHSIPVMCGACVAVGTAFAVYEYGGGNIKGMLVQMSEEEKQEWRASFFKKKEQKTE